MRKIYNIVTKSYYKAKVRDVNNKNSIIKLWTKTKYEKN